MTPLIPTPPRTHVHVPRSWFVAAAAVVVAVVVMRVLAAAAMAEGGAL